MISSRTDLEEARLRSLNALASIQQETQTLEEQNNSNRNGMLNCSGAIVIGYRSKSIFVSDQLDELTSTLDDLIAEEERIRSEEAAGTRVMRSERVMNDEELVAVASTFRNSKGQLPWPVDNGTITQKFGLRIHPVFGTRTNNPGVEISAPPPIHCQGGE